MGRQLEFDFLLLNSRAARDLAAKGRFGEGHSWLTNGLRRAEWLLSEGLGYGEELVARYRSVIASYEESYAVRVA